MKLNLKPLLIMAVMATRTISYLEIENYHDHFSKVHSNNYVLAIFHNPGQNSKLTKPLKNILAMLDQSDVVKQNNIIIEYADIVKIPFFDKHYDLEGNNTVKLFIRNQMVDMESFSERLEQMYKNSVPERDFALEIETFIRDKLNGISIEIRDITHFRDLINDKRVLGLYSGSRNDNFKKYFHVARKNIDFTFAHTFDLYLRESIFEEFGKTPVPQGDSFAIVRHSEDLNEYDYRMITVYEEFTEKGLTEFLEFERFDKLRDPETGNEIVKRMFFKAQPLLLYIRSNNKESTKFETFKEAVKALPKQFIYSYTDTEAKSSAAYLQLFMMAEKMMMPDILFILWVSPSRKVRIEPYNGEFSKQGIIDFVFNFNEEHEAVFDSMRNHLYDKEPKEEDRLTTEEL